MIFQRLTFRLIAENTLFNLYKVIEYKYKDQLITLKLDL